MKPSGTSSVIDLEEEDLLASAQLLRSRRERLWMQNHLHTQTTFLDSPTLAIRAALNVPTTFEYLILQCSIFSYHIFYTLMNDVPIESKLCCLYKMFMYSSKIESAVLLRNNITLSSETVDLKMVPACSQHENQRSV